MTTKNFLTLLYEHLQPEQRLYLWTLPDKLTHQFKDITKPPVLQGDIYIGIGTTTQPLDKHQRPKSTEITAIPGVWADIDILHPIAHKSTKYPPTIEDAMSLIPDDLPPTMVVNTGYGIHIYWLFREPWEFDTAEEREQAQSLLRSLQYVIKHNAAQKGWKIDTTSDLARVLRLPGTMNYKIPDSPVMCEIITESNVRYNPDEIEDLVPPVPDPGQCREEKFERRETDGTAALMLSNCMFMQHCQLNAATLPYDEWLAAITNIVRASDGIEAAHEISALDTKRYNRESVQKKLTEALNNMAPQTCEYIRNVIGFPGCPADGCAVQAPCGWSLSRTGQARATLRGISKFSKETVLIPEVIGALAILQKDYPDEVNNFKEQCRGNVNLNTLKKEVKNQRLHLVQAGMQHNQQMISKTVPDIPLDLIVPAGFSCTNNGVTYYKVTENGTVDFEASSNPVIISSVVSNIDTQTEKLEICFKYENVWRKKILPSSTIVNSRTVIGLADSGVRVTSETAKYLVKWLGGLLKTNKDLIPTSQSVSKLGWREDEFILPTVTNKYKVDIDDDGSQQSIAGFTIKGSKEKWFEKAKYMRKSHKSRFILSASFAVPLLYLLGQRNFAIHNWGTSRDGKTATLWFALSVWGDPDRIIATFDATPTGLERRAALMSDLPLAINEREVLNKYKKEEINSLIYQLTEGKGKSRGTKTGLQQLASWRTIVMTTGEGQLSNSGSLDGVMTRLLEVQGGPLSHDKDFAKGLYHFLPRNHGHAGPMFLEKLQEADQEELLKFYNEARSELGKLYLDNIDSHIDAMACIYVADCLVSKWLFDETHTRSNALAMCRHILDGLITKNEASESKRAWDAFKGWLAENEDRFTPSISGNKYGYWEGPVMCIFRETINKFLDDRYSGNRKIIREWAEQGKIETFPLTGGKKRYDTPGKSFGGRVSPQVIKLRREEER